MRADSAMPKIVAARVLPQERLTIEKAARKHGLTLSQFIRKALAEAAIRAAA